MLFGRKPAGDDLWDRAVAMVSKRLDDATRRHGPGSFAVRNAQHTLAHVLIATDQIERGLDALRLAEAGGLPADENQRREVLTFNLNLGQMLQRHGKLDEARATLYRGMVGRRTHYGAAHAGYAFGLEPLGEVELERGEIEEARTHLTAAVAIFGKNGHPRLASALANLSAVRTGGGDDSPVAIERVNGAPESFWNDILGAALESRERRPPSVTRALLAKIETKIASLSGGADLHAQALAAIANHEAEQGPLGDPEIRLGAIRRSRALHQKVGKRRAEVQDLLGLALALDSFGRRDEAAASYADASRLAESVGDLALLTQTKRNHGLFLADFAGIDTAEPILRGSVDTARQLGDREAIGRALCALGIQLQHAGSADDARPLLAEAERLLPPEHPDAIYAICHAQALRDGRNCGCDNMPDALAEAFRVYVTERLPAGLLENLDVSADDNDFAIAVHLKREPRADEVEMLQRTIHHAMGAFRQRLRRSYPG